MHDGAAVSIGIERHDHELPAGDEPRELLLRLPAIGLVHLGGIDVREPEVHLDALHLRDERIAILDPHQRPVKHALVAGMGRVRGIEPRGAGLCGGNGQEQQRKHSDCARHSCMHASILLDAPREPR